MIIEWAHLCLIAAFVLHFPLMFPFYACRGAQILPSIKALHFAQMAFFLAAATGIVFSFLSHDFSVKVVAEHSSTTLPWYYCISALWGSHEGSLLLWVLLLCVWRCFFICDGSLTRDDQIAVTRVLTLISFGISAFLLFSSSPMARLLPNFPHEGHDLNPLLQDIGMATHPPFLYMGYVAFAIPYAFALVMLWRQKVIENWESHLRIWVLMAWSFLGVGIALGSWWAYRELGWGGWWFWDPVENASLMPWLGGTLLLHGLSWSKKSDAAQRWTLLLALLCFVLSLLGTFLVRSGVLVSVHSFASDPSRGAWILGLLVFYGMLAIIAYARSAALLKEKRARWHYYEINQAVIGAILLTVVLGTLYPIIVDALGLGKISVGEPYYNQITPWLVLPGLFALVYWAYHKNLKYGVAVFLGSAVLLFYVLKASYVFDHPLAYCFVVLSGLGIWGHLVVGYQWIQKPRGKSWPMLIAHIAFLMLLMSLALAHTLSHDKNAALRVHDEVHFAGFDLRLEGFQEYRNKHEHGIKAIIDVRQHGKHLATLAPGRRIYDVSQTNLALTDALVRFGFDLYIAMGTPIDDQEQWQFHFQYKPMVRWLWLSVLLMSAASIFAWSFRQREQEEKQCIKE